MATATAPPPAAAAPTTANGAPDARQVRGREEETRAHGTPCLARRNVPLDLGVPWEMGVIVRLSRLSHPCAPIDRSAASLARRANSALPFFVFLCSRPLQIYTHPQSFLAVYEKLRDELVNDGLLGDQPAFAKAYMKEVSGN
jgi:hypothetical protein